MEYVIFDLEWNQPYDNDISFIKRTGMPLAGEIIQIGAIKLDAKFHHIDSFNCIVKPKYLKLMHCHVQRLTHITNEDLALGTDFVTAFRRFDAWCGDDVVLLTWGVDDITMLRDNLRLHKLPGQLRLPWYDAQLLYAHFMHGNQEQVSLKRAMEELSISSDDLTAHDALHDSIFTGRVCQQIPLAEGMAIYDELTRESTHSVYFPDPLAFFIYENFEDKEEGFRLPKVHRVYCPRCQEPLQLRRVERIARDKQMTIGHCKKHGDFAVLWRVSKYMARHRLPRFYITKTITEAPPFMTALYEKKAHINKVKWERYLARKAQMESQGKEG